MAQSITNDNAFGSLHAVCCMMAISEGGDGAMFDDKQVVVLGERDGIAGGAIEACVKAAGGTVAFAATECFV
jgi:betaine reductase